MSEPFVRLKDVTIFIPSASSLYEGGRIGAGALHHLAFHYNRGCELPVGTVQVQQQLVLVVE